MDESTSMKLAERFVTATGYSADFSCPVCLKWSFTVAPKPTWSEAVTIAAKLIRECPGCLKRIVEEGQE